MSSIKKNPKIQEKSLIKNNQEIKYRELDIYGLPKNSEYNLKQKEREKFIQEEGEVIFEINIGINPQEKIEPNIDYQYEEMTNEQKELFEALNCKEDAYEKLEENFCIDNFCFEEENENKIKPQLDILETDVKELSGDQIARNDFLKIIEEDAQMLNLKFDNNKKEKKNTNSIKIQKQKLEEQKKILEAQIKLLDIQIKNDKCDEEEIEDYIEDDEVEFKNNGNELDGVNDENLVEEENEHDLSPDAILKQQILNKVPRKNEIILEENVQSAIGGGTIIFRKIKKVKEPIKKKYENIEHGDEEEEVEEIAKDLMHNDGTNKKVEIDELADDYSLDFENDEPLNNEEIEDLRRNYENIKKQETTKNVPNDDIIYFRKEKRKKYTHISEDEVEEEEEKSPEFVDGLEVLKKNLKFQKTAFRIENDNVIKNMAIIDEKEAEIEDRPLLKKLIDEECELAPEEKIIHENYYCMKIIKEDLNVVPIKLKKDKRKEIKKNESDKKDLSFLVRIKNETKEEKKKRKEEIKILKEERKLKNKEKKETYNELRKQTLREKNCQKIGNPLIGISVHKLV